MHASLLRTEYITAYYTPKRNLLLPFGFLASGLHSGSHPVRSPSSRRRLLLSR